MRSSRTPRPAIRRVAALAAAGALSITLAACGGNDTSGPTTTGGTTTAPSTAASAAPGEHNSADVMFAQMMIPHHEQAVEMAQLASSRADNPEVKALAAQIEAAQDPEITTMKGWLASWGESDSTAGMNGDMGHEMSGMMSDADMASLQELSGPDFDREFLTMMRAHHQGAIEMGEQERDNGSYEPAKQLAADIVRSQTAEIDTMGNLLEQG